MLVKGISPPTLLPYSSSPPFWQPLPAGLNLYYQPPVLIKPCLLPLENSSWTCDRASLCHGRGCLLLIAEVTLKALAGRRGDFSYSCVAWGCWAEVLYLASQALRCCIHCLPAQPLLLSTFTVCIRWASLRGTVDVFRPSWCCQGESGKADTDKGKMGLWCSFASEYRGES